MITLDRAHRIWTLTIVNERRRNALTREMVVEIIDAVAEFEADESARVLLLRGAGEAAFCSGADIDELARLARSGRPFVPTLTALYARLLSLPKPVIAVVNGDAVGGGLELALACDFVLVRRGARVGLPELHLAAVPRYGIGLVARLAGRRVAVRLGMLGELVAVEQVPQLATAIVDEGALDGEAQRLAACLAAQSPAALAAVKEIALRASELTLAELAELPSALAAVRAARPCGSVTSASGRPERPASR